MPVMGRHGLGPEAGMAGMIAARKSYEHGRRVLDKLRKSDEKAVQKGIEEAKKLRPEEPLV